MAEAVTNQTPVTCVKDENVCMQGLCESLKLTSQTPLVISFFSIKIVSGSEAREEHTHNTHYRSLSRDKKKALIMHARF